MLKGFRPGGLLVMIVLAGCTSAAERAANQRIEEMDAQIDYLNTKHFTAFDGMPSSGSVDFDSNVLVLVDMDSSGDATTGDFTALGKGVLTATFDGPGTLSGSFGNFAGLSAANRYEFFDGTLDVSNGVIAATQPNDFPADIDGRLTGAGESYEIDDTIYGRFVGTPIVGLIAVGDGAGVLVDDSFYRTGAIAISGEATP